MFDCYLYKVRSVTENRSMYDLFNYSNFFWLYVEVEKFA